MWKKITSIPIMAYHAFTGFAQSFRRDERGLSGVVVAVLLILVAVLAVVLIWGFLSGWLVDLWDQITGTAEDIK
ncbi:MAG: hypothetical protein FWH55_00520 [Oscillospiraceae bacterium]|nr:hypothetical protein [Oscillospiraceae bacterium]